MGWKLILCPSGGETPNPEQFVAAAAELASPHTQLLMAHEVFPACRLSTFYHSSHALHASV